MAAFYILDIYINVKYYFTNNAESNFFKYSLLFRKSLLSVSAISSQIPLIFFFFYHFTTLNFFNKKTVQKEEEGLMEAYCSSAEIGRHGFSQIILQGAVGSLAITSHLVGFLYLESLKLMVPSPEL